MSLMAHDTTLFLSDLKSLEIAIIESLKGVQTKTWTSKALGVWFSSHESEIIELNFNERIQIMQKLVNIIMDL